MRSIQDIGGWVDVGFGHGGVFLLIYLRGGWVLVWFFLQNTSQPLHMIVHTSAILRSWDIHEDCEHQVRPFFAVS